MVYRLLHKSIACLFYSNRKIRDKCIYPRDGLKMFQRVRIEISLGIEIQNNAQLKWNNSEKLQSLISLIKRRNRNDAYQKTIRK